MWRSSSRSVRLVDTELRALCTASQNACAELEEVRRRQAELADMEAQLVVACELRARRVDVLLDERLRAARPPEDVGSRAAAHRPTEDPGGPVLAEHAYSRTDQLAAPLRLRDTP